ncbi:MAG: YkgJ family cysteine cluster protein [Gammaproteobacteria bacterium]|nr:YkgJ family cysteine cluster protein [Gammaproteobacteria bacterium]
MHVTEKIEGFSRIKLQSQLQKHQSGEACPFLVDNVCSIYEFRPYACRHFNVFNQVCDEGEDAYYTRKEDVLTPSQSSIDDAYFETLPFYDLEQNEENKYKVEKGEINKVIHVLQELNWESLADKMTAFTRAN